MVEFDAFSVPAAIADLPEVGLSEVGQVRDVTRRPALRTYDAGTVRVRHVHVTANWIRRIGTALQAAREGLIARSASDIAEALGATGGRFLDDKDPMRAEALALLPSTSGLSREMSIAVLDGMASDWTESRLLALLRADLGGEHVVDGFVAEDNRRVMAIGPSLCVQILAGSVPGVGVSALVRSLLVKAPTLIKPGHGDEVLPVLFARALRESDPDLADALAVVYWPGEEADLTAAAVEGADVVTAYGADDSVAAVGATCAVTVRFVPYHHRISVGVVGRDVMSESELETTAADVAEAVSLFDQRGCVSPQLIFVEEGGLPVERLANALAARLGVLEDGRLPSGPVGTAEASRLQQLRGSAELVAAAGDALLLHGGSAPWTVIVERAAGALGLGAGRTVRIRPVAEAEEVADLLGPLTPHLQTVGVAGLKGRVERLARALGRAGASRVVPFRSVPFPPPWWHHDGRGPLRDLVRWVDLEE